jgi:uncharacterized protein YraI
MSKDHQVQFRDWGFVPANHSAKVMINQSFPDAPHKSSCALRTDMYSIRRFAMIHRRLLQGLLAASLLMATAAYAQQAAYTVRPANVRAGPERDYPLIAQLPPGIPVTVMGCLSDYRWCDVVFNGDRGWMYAGNLAYAQGGRTLPFLSYAPSLRLPIVVFSIGGYWDQYYRSRPWYPQRNYWLKRGPQYRAAPYPGPRIHDRRDMDHPRRGSPGAVGSPPPVRHSEPARRGPPRPQTAPPSQGARPSYDRRDGVAQPRGPQRSDGRATEQGRARGAPGGQERGSDRSR